MKRTLYAIDTETFPIGPEAVAPRLVSLQVAYRDSRTKTITANIYGNHPDDDQLGVLTRILSDESIQITSHNAKFDMAVCMFMYPSLTPLIFEAYAQGRIHCTIVREKLLNLSWHGKLEKRFNVDGSYERFEYSLLALENKYLGKNRKEEKESEDSWRNNFSMLDGKKAIQYPARATKYALEDAWGHLRIWEMQRAKVKELGPPVSFETQEHKAACDFALFLMTCRGINTDEKKKAEIAAMLKIELDEGKMPLLLKYGILRAAQPPRPHKNGSVGPDGKVRMTQAKKASINKKKLEAFVQNICRKNNMPVVMTEPSDNNPKGKVSCRKGSIEDIVHLSPTLAEYQHRQSLQKIVTTDLPRMKGKIIHPNFNVIVETGRTSSFAGKDPLYPSSNVQNPHPKIREVYMARKGYVLCSTDYSYLELCTLGQTNYTLFKRSTHRDIINAGIDPHTFLGATLAYHMDRPFRKACERMKLRDRWGWLDAFLAAKDDPDPKVVEFFKHYRKLAKPTGLGYPGGLGAQKFIQFAKESYGVRVNLETAKQLRELWFDAFPEMRDYFAHVNKHCEDTYNEGDYCYDTPLGMHRAGASYCATANGLGLQSPAAEGATAAVWNVVRACYDPSYDSILKEVHPLAFIHDEILAEIPDNEYKDARAREIAYIMVESMKNLTPDVNIRATPVLMVRWNKDAEQVFDEQGMLKIWTPKPKSIAA